MTLDIPALKALAEDALSHRHDSIGMHEAYDRLNAAMTPATVLALIERVKAAEAAAAERMAELQRKGRPVRLTMTEANLIAHKASTAEYASRLQAREADLRAKAAEAEAARLREAIKKASGICAESGSRGPIVVLEYETTEAASDAYHALVKP